MLILSYTLIRPKRLRFKRYKYFFFLKISQTEYFGRLRIIFEIISVKGIVDCPLNYTQYITASSLYKL